MKIEHIAVYVNQLEEMKDFFVSFFGAVPNEGYYNPKTGFRSYFLSFSDGVRLEIMHRPDLCDTQKQPFRTGYAHIAFCVGSKQKVDELTQQLSQAGYPVVSGPRTTGDGYYESCILGPEENLIELTI